MTFDNYSVASIQFAPGCSANLANLLTTFKLSRPLIVTDKGVLEYELLDSSLKSLGNANLDYCLYSDVQADPPESNVLAATEIAREHNCDGVVGFGGGSSMDVAKLVAALLASDQALQDMYGVDQITGSRLPLVQVPTTSGTGSEATHVAIITTGESSKAGVVSRILFADAILLDPELTLRLPPDITASTGIDAMVHAIEAFTSKHLKNPISDMQALKALSLMSPSITTAVEDGSDMQARSNMLLGAMLAGQAFANAPVGAVHALAYPLGGLYHIPHGLSNSLVLPHVLRFNAPSAQSLYYQILQSMSIDCKPAEAGERLANYFRCLAQDLNIPTRLRDFNIGEKDLVRLAKEAMLQQRLLHNNPREISLDQAFEIYQQAF